MRGLTKDFIDTTLHAAGRVVSQLQMGQVHLSDARMVIEQLVYVVVSLRDSKVTPLTSTPAEIAKALTLADWSNTPIGNKVLINAAIRVLNAGGQE